MTPPDPVVPTLDALLVHSGWVERLARRLVLDEARAADVVQTTWLEALERPPRDGRNPRGWLGTVVRNAARRVMRGEERRAVRERRAARPDATADTAELVDRAILQRDLVSRVIELDEPYRSVVLLRFFEELSTAAIAARLGRPRNTVQTQLARGLERLRERLDGEYGSREAWGLALLPLAGVQRAAATTGAGLLLAGAGAWLLNWKVLVPLALVALGILGWRRIEGGAPPPVETTTAAVSDEELAEPDVRVDVQVGADEGERVAVEVRPAEPSAPRAEAGEVRALEGVVVDVEGAPVPGVRFTWKRINDPHFEGDMLWSGNQGRKVDERELAMMRAGPVFLENFARDFDDPAAVKALVRSGPENDRGEVDSGPGGSLVLDLSLPPELARDLRLDLAVADEDLVCIAQGQRRSGPEHERIFVVAPAVEISGVARDQHGAPVVGAHASVSVSVEGLSSFPFLLDGTTFWNASAQTEADGRFALGKVPRLPGVRVAATRRGYEETHAEVPEESTEELVLLFERDPDARVVTGRVVHVDGTPASGVWVAFGQDGASTNESGQFRIEVSYVYPDAALVARKRGNQPGVVEGFARRWMEDPSVGDGVVLRLGGPPETIRGRVLRADGSPAPGLTVSLADPTYMTSSSSDTVEAHGVPTDEDGAFELAELIERDYTLRVFDQETFVVFDSDPVPAGTQDLVLVQPADPTYPVIQGRVLSIAGVPVEDAEVGLAFYTYRTAGSATSRRSMGVRTDLDGRFSLRDVPRTGVWLRAYGTDLDSPEVAVEDLDPDGVVELRVTLKQLLRVVLASTDPADAYEFQDASGEPVVVLAHYPNVTRGDRRVSVDPERDVPTCEVPEDAVSIVLFDGDEVLRRVPLEFHPGDLRTIRP